MSLFHGDYIRVITPETTDGVNLIYDDNGKKVTKTSFLAFTPIALKNMEEENAKLPTHLKHQIEIVHS